MEDSFLENKEQQNKEYHYRPQKPSLLKNAISILLLISLIAVMFLATTLTSKTIIGGDQFMQDLYAGKIHHIVEQENYIEIYYK